MKNTLCILGFVMLAWQTSFATPFSPYADISINTRWSSEDQDMVPDDFVGIAKKANLRAMHLAFITDAGNCEPAWAGQAAYAISKNWAQKLAKNLHKEGVGITVSFGGANGQDISAECSKFQMQALFEKMIRDYHAQQLDFDIENGSARLTPLLDAIFAFQQTHPDTKISFTLPVLPEGLVAQGREIVKQARDKGIHFNVNIMAMDYGPSYTGNMGDYAIKAAESLANTLKELWPSKTDALIWQHVEITPMIGVNDVNTELFSLEDARKLRAFATEKSIGQLSMWSLGRDRPCADIWASPICSGRNLQTQDFQFSEALR